MKTWQGILFGLFVGLLSSAVILLITADPPSHSVELLPAPTPQPMLVHIAGAVAKPGVVELPHNSRVEDAVEAAGGFLPDADQQAVNLAARLNDGDQIVVVKIGEPTPYLRSTPQSSSNETAASSPEYPMNINQVNQAELESLPAIGPTRAKAIIDYRQKNGPFKTIEDLLKVPGIGTSTFEQFKDLITTGNH